MAESSSRGILGKFAFAILVIALVDLGFLNYWVVKKDKELSLSQAAQLRELKKVETFSASTEESADEEGATLPSPVAEVKEEEVKVSAQTKDAPVVQTAQKEIFVPLGSGKTESGTYVELAGLEVTIDPTKYSAIESMVFEASLWVEGGNGRSWAELYVVDDKNPLIESQISNPTSTATLKQSGNIPIPSSKKTYRVLGKSELTEYTAYVDNARVKITLK